MQIVVGPDVEQVVIDFLPAELASRGFDFVVSSQSAGDNSVTVYRTGGIAPTMITDQPQLTFDVRARSESRAALAALLVRGLVGSLDGRSVGGVFVYSVTDFGGPANLPEPNYAGARYRWTCSLHVRSSVVA